jgi:hypothetical protein
MPLRCPVRACSMRLYMCLYISMCVCMCVCMYMRARMGSHALACIYAWSAHRYLEGDARSTLRMRARP